MVHYYDKKQPSKLRLREFSAVLRGALFSFRTGSGLFSPRQVDAGTKLLVDSCLMEDGWSVLDLGCGYGIVGIVIKRLYSAADVFMVDINERAVMLAEYNAALNKVSVHIANGHLYEPLGNMAFDTILVNPPYVAGRKIIFELVHDAKRYLKNEGLLQVVARHQKGGKMIAAKMKAIFGNVTDHTRRAGYHIYVSRNV